MSPIRAKTTLAFAWPERFHKQPVVAVYGPMSSFGKSPVSHPALCVRERLIEPQDWGTIVRERPPDGAHNPLILLA